MVHLERGSDVAELEGTLQMRPEALVFTASSGDETVIEFERASGAKRVRGSPVLMVAWTRNGDKARTAFYFAKPPPLKPPERLEHASAMELVRIGRTSPRRQKRANVGYLSMRAGALKPLLKKWAAESAGHIKRARGSG